MPLIEKVRQSIFFEPEAVELQQELVQHKYRGITVLEAFLQEFVRIQPKHPVSGEAIRKTPFKDGEIACR
jgi:hypothetical protein